MSPAGPTAEDPWWASGRDPLDGLATDEDPVDAHRDARRGGAPPPGDDPGQGADAGRLASDAIDLVSRLAAEVGRRVAARGTANAAGPAPGSFTHPDPTPPDPEDVGRDDGAGHGHGPDAGWRRFADGMAPHEDGRVCDACPVCIGLRALRQVRPEVIGHLSDAAHHVSLALRAFAEAQAGADDDLEKIDLDP